MANKTKRACQVCGKPLFYLNTERDKTKKYG